MQRAVNPQTGEVLFLVDNKWTPPAQTAKNDAGDTAYLVGNKWEVVKTARLPEPILSPEEQVMGAVGAPSEGGIASIAPRQQALQPSTGGLNAMTADEYRAQVAAREAKGYDRTLGGSTIDAGVTFLKSAIGLPEAFVGLADIPTLGYAGKLLEQAGYKPKEAKEILDTYLSEAQQYANRQVKETKGFLPTIGAALQNPSTIATSVGESLPQMLGGASIARGIVKAAPGLAPYLAGAIGEGVLGAGSAAEQIRQGTKDGLLTGKQALSAIGSGVGTAAFGVAGGKLAKKFGFDDIDTLLVGGGAQTGSRSVKDFAKKATASGISEGVFEEMPQSAQETMWMNYATDKPLLEGVPEAAGMGLVTGATMGVGATALGGRAKAPEREKYFQPEGGLAELMARQKGFLRPEGGPPAAPTAPASVPPAPPAGPAETIQAPSSDAMDTQAMLAELIDSINPPKEAPTIPAGIVKPTPVIQEPEAVVTTPEFTVPAGFKYTLLESPAYEGIEPLSLEDADFELEALEDSANKGRMTPERFAQSEIGRRLGTLQIMQINEGLRTDPIGILKALRNNLAPTEAPAAPEAPAGPTLKEQYDNAAKLNLLAPDAFRNRRINQEQYDKIESDYERIKTEYQASIPKATLTPIQQEATVIADGLEELGQNSFVTGMRSAIARNQVTKDNLEFYRSRLKQEQAKQNALDEGIERPSEKFEWTNFFRNDPKDLNKLKLFNSKAPPAVKQALQTVTDTLQALTNRLNDEGYTMYGTPNSTVPQEIKNLRSQIQMRSAGGVKLINAFEALDKGFNRSKKTTNKENLDAAIQDIKVDAAEAQKVLQRSIPEPEEIVSARGTLAEARKQMDTLAYKSGSLWSALSGKLDPEEVREIFGRNPSLGNKKLGVTKKSGKRGTYISELAANGLLDTFLPPKMRHKSDMFDAAESAQYIKDAVANKDYLPHDVKEEIENIQKAVGPLGDLIDEYLTIEEQNRELQIAFDEQREADQAAEIVEPESEDRPAEPSERPAGEFKLTTPTKDELKAKQDEIDRLSKENERLSKEVERKAKADEEAKDFVLTGSNREADQAAARGQKDIFAEDNTFNPVELGKEFPEIGAEAFAYLDTTNTEVRKAIGALYKKGDIDGAINALENMPKNIAVVEKPKDNKQEIADLKKEQKTLMLQIIKAGLEETPAQEARMAEIDKRLRELEGKPAIQQVEKPVAKQRNVEEIQDELQDLEDQLDLELNKEKRKSLVSEISRLQGELIAAEGRAGRAAAEAAPTEAETEAADEAAEEAIRNRAEAEIDEGPIGQAIAKIENGDIETKGQIRSLVNKLERDGTLDDVEEVREGLSDREQDASEVLDTLNGLLDDARDTAIDERVDELLEERAQEETAEEPSFEVETPEGNTLTYPAAYGLVNKGYKVLALDDPRTYVDNGGKAQRTFEKDGVRLSLSPQIVLFQDKNRVLLARGNKKDVTLEVILVDSQDRGQGKASQALKDLVDIADKNGLVLYAEPTPLKDKKTNQTGLNFDQLVKLYKKVGFDFPVYYNGPSTKVMERAPEVEVLPAAEPQIAGQVGFEPYTMEGQFTEVGDEEQRTMITDQSSKLSDAQINTLEQEYGAKNGSDEFFEALRKDVIAYVTEGAKAIHGKIRSIIRQIANGLLSVAIVFNPQFVSKPYTIAVPQYDIRTSEVIKDLPREAKSMSDAAKRAYGVIYPTLESQLKANDKLFIIADKQSGNTYMFQPDGSLLLQSKTLFGAAIGDFIKGDNEIVSNRITPAGLFDLGLRDAKRSEGEARTAGEYDFGKVFVLDKSYMGRNGPFSNTIMHSVWLNETDAKKRLAALDKPGADDSRYSYGCINVNKETYRYLITNHLGQMDGAKIFIVPENGTNVMDFVNGKATYSDDIIRQRVTPVTKTTKTEKQRAAPKVEERTIVGREEEPGIFMSIEGKKLPPGRSPELAAAARQVKEGTMTAAEFDKLVNKYRPIRVYEEPLKPATRAEMVDALSSEKKDKVSPDIPEGTRVGLRLDIPAFNRKGVYVVTIHEKGNASGPGKAIGYDSVAVINNVNFGTGSQKKALNIATGEAKDALQTMEGEFVKSDPDAVYAAALKAMDDPAWTQIGVDPARHTYFYDRNTTQPVVAADQVIQIGNTVLAKNVTYGRKEDFLYNLEDDLVKLTDQMAGDMAEDEKKRSPSLIRKLKTYNRQRQAGKMSSEMYVLMTDAAIREDYENDLLNPAKPRQRGYLHIQEKLSAAVRRGELTREAYDLANWFMQQNEALVDDLGISIKANKREGAGGFYNNLSRIITLFKNAGSDLTTVHEILHHLERMMPLKIQQAIRKAWLTQLTKAAKAIKDPVQKLYFEAVLDANFGDNKHAMVNIPEGAGVAYSNARMALEDMARGNTSVKLAEMLLLQGAVPLDMYQFFNPSEFWAVNGSRIVEGRFEAVKGGTLAKLKNWLRELGQTIKSLFGLKSDASIIRALDSLAKSDGKFVTDEMLGVGDYQSIERRNYEGGEAPEPDMEIPEMSFMDDVIYKYGDKLIDTKRLIQSIQSTGRKINEKFDAYMKEENYHGRLAKRTKNFLNDEMRPVLEDMQERGVTLDELETFLLNRHAKEANAYIARINPTGFPEAGSSVSDAAADKYMAELTPEKRKDLMALAAKVDAIVKETQRVLVDNGLETQDTIDEWNKTYKNYVPLMRDQLDFVHTGRGVMGGFATRGSASKRRVGSDKPVIDIFANIAMQRERALRRSEQARVGRALYGMAIKHPNPGFWLAINPDAIKDKDKLEAELISLGLTPEDAKSIIQEPRQPMFDKKTGQVKYQVNPLLRNSPNVFPVRINGEDRFIFFNPNDPRALRMVESIKNLDTEKLGDAIGTVGMVTRWFASVNTQYNIVFGGVNFLRDLGAASLNLSTTEIAGKEKQVRANVLPALRAIYRDLRGKGATTKDMAEMQNWFERFQLAGGQTGYQNQFAETKRKGNVVEQELKRLNRGNVKKSVDAVFDWLSDYNDAIENAVRLSAFKVAVESGLSEDKAASIAKNLTVNFNRKGARTGLISSLYAFFNAAVQGSARMVETLRGPMGKKIIFGGMFLGSMQAIALAMAGFDDDEPPEFVKDKNLIIPIPYTDKKYLSIPMPLGFNMFPGFGRLAMETLLIETGMIRSRKGPGDKVMSAVSLVFDAFNPLGGAGNPLLMAMPTILDPFAAIYSNKDAFGRPIYREDKGNAPTPGYERSRENASVFSKKLAEAINYVTSPAGTQHTKGFFSPTADQIDYFIGQVTGGVGRELMKVGEFAKSKAVTQEEIPAYKLPIVGRFYGEADSPAATRSRFYENVKEMAKHEYEIKGLRKDKVSPTEYIKANPEARLWQRANNVENQISKLNKEKRAMIERDAPREALKRKEDEILKKMTEFNNQVRRGQ